MEIGNIGLVGYSGEAFVNYMQNLNQATNGTKSLPTGYEPETVKGIISNKKSQDLYDQMHKIAEVTHDKAAKVNQTDKTDIYNSSGITSINNFINVGKNINISV